MHFQHTKLQELHQGRCSLLQAARACEESWCKWWRGSTMQSCWIDRSIYIYYIYMHAHYIYNHRTNVIPILIKIGHVIDTPCISIWVTIPNWCPLKPLMHHLVATPCHGCHAYLQQEWPLQQEGVPLLCGVFGQGSNEEDPSGSPHTYFHWWGLGNILNIYIICNII